ncbi:MAG: hypothetical protein NT077_00540, partial [Candidatus Taylorbacteria bacterium]|nr:hypothetical protein [Candidatus Taylorbacteria bacterium]
AGKDFSDIRIITSDNIEVPYFLTQNAVVHSGDEAASILNMTDIGGERTFVLDTGSEGRVHNGLSLDTSTKNFRRRVSVFSSSELLDLSRSNWHPVTTSGYIFKFTDPVTGFTSGKNSINFPANTARYLKVVINAGDEGVVGVNSARIFSDTRIDVPSYENTVSVTTFNNPTHRTTEVTIDQKISGHMTNAVTLDATDKNFSRRVIVETSDDMNSWRQVGEGSISG